MILGNDSLTELPEDIPGRALYKIGQEKEVQTPYINEIDTEIAVKLRYLECNRFTIPNKITLSNGKTYSIRDIKNPYVKEYWKR